MIRAVIIAALLIAAYLAAAARLAVIAARRLRQRARDGAVDDMLAVICDPCNGRGGTWCKCAAKCASQACGAEDTGIRGWSDEEIAYLNGKTGELPQ